MGDVEHLKKAVSRAPLPQLKVQRSSNDAGCSAAFDPLLTRGRRLKAQFGAAGVTEVSTGNRERHAPSAYRVFARPLSSPAYPIGRYLFSITDDA
jgi:hypothetical protein